MDDKAPRLSHDGAPSRLDLTDLAYFVEVAESRSFRIAAATMFTSQPTVSRAVSRLEALLDVQLLERGPRGAHVTTHGAILLAGARRLLASASDLQRDVAELGSSIVTLGAAASTTRSFLARFLSEWMPQHKDVQVAPVEDTDCGLLSKVQSGECDVAIVAGPIPDTVEALHIRSVELVALFNHASSFADATEKVPVGVFDVANEPLLLNFPGCPSRDLLAREFSSFGATPNVVYECSAGTTLAALCEGGLGVAIFGAVMDLSEFDVCVRPLVGNRGQRLRYDLCVVWARNTSRTWIRELGIEMATSCRRPTVMDASTAWCAPLHTGSSRVDKGS